MSAARVRVPRTAQDCLDRGEAILAERHDGESLRGATERHMAAQSHFLAAIARALVEREPGPGDLPRLVHWRPPVDLVVDRQVDGTEVRIQGSQVRP